MPKVKWVTRNVATGEIRFWLSRERATSHAVRENRRDREHPAFHLWVGATGKRLNYEGRLTSGREVMFPHPALDKAQLCWNKSASPTREM